MSFRARKGIDLGEGFSIGLKKATEAAGLWIRGGLLRLASGLQIVAGGLTVTAGGATVTAGDLDVTAGEIHVSTGKVYQAVTVVDDNSKDMTMAAADIVAGINIHTSASSAATVTTDTGAAIIAALGFKAINDSCTSYYINDGNQTVTFAAGDGDVVMGNVANTIPTNSGALLVWRLTAADKVTLYIIGSVAA